MRGICAAVLVFEGMVVFFATLVALDLSDVDDGTVWAVGGAGAVLCPVACRAAALALGVPRGLGAAGGPGGGRRSSSR